MTIYTSYFANLKNLPEDIVPVSISLYPPSWYKGLQYKKLAPTTEILSNIKSSGNKEKYVIDYINQVLNPLNKETVIEELSELSNNKDIALLCFEKPSDFCHRKIVAKWLGITEFKKEENTLF